MDGWRKDIRWDRDNLEGNRDNPSIDPVCKKLLSYRKILANIIKECAIEFADSSIDDIAYKYIMEDPLLTVSTLPDKTNPSLILALSGDQTTVTEGEVFFDLFVRVRQPNEDDGICAMYINVEVQNAFNLKQLLRRSVFYSARMISSQYNRDFQNAEYEKLKKVYSIWICPRADVHFKNTVNKLSLCSENLVGNAAFDENLYDLINIVFVCLGNNNEENRLLKLLNAIFTPGLPANAVLNLLRDDYEIIADNDMKGDVKSMCDLRQGYIDMGKEEALGDVQETIQKIKQFMSEHPKCTPAEAIERFAQTEEIAKTMRLIYSE